MRKLCVLLLVSSFVSAAHAGLLSTAIGNGADAFVGNDGNKGYQTNYGDSDYKGGMDLRNYADARAHEGLVKFDLSKADGDLSGALLEFFVVDSGGTRTWSVYGLNDGAVDENWGEMDVTYDNFSGFLNTDPVENGNYIIGDMTLLGTVDVSSSDGVAVASNTTDLNLDSFLAADTDGLVTLVLVTPTDGRQNYVMTKDGLNNATYNPDGLAFAPRLNLPNATVVPEPATMALMGLGSLLAVRRKRR